MTVRRHAASEAETDLVRALQALWGRIWPPSPATPRETAPPKPKERRPDPSPYAMFHYIRDADGQALAAAKTFARSVRHLPTGRERTVLALAGVCSAPDRRGEGLGKAVVLDAFARLETEGERFALALFQTGVPEFYEKLGARAIGNRFINSRDPRGSWESPWWDKRVMIYPAVVEWPEGDIDLLGPGY